MQGFTARWQPESKEDDPHCTAEIKGYRGRLFALTTTCWATHNTQFFIDPEKIIAYYLYFDK